MRASMLKRYVAAALFCIIASVLVVLATASTAMRYRAPDVAIRLWPWNGEARGSLAGRLVLTGDAATARRLATEATQQVPGDAVTLRALGLAQPASEMNGRALRLMRLAAEASRRDLQTNLWFIEYNVARGDIANAIRYYDFSLKSSADAETLLFPILVPAMSSPEIASAVRTKLLSRPVWTTSFLQYAFSSGAADGQLIKIVLDLSRDRTGLPLDLKRQYAQKLAERGNLAGLDDLARGLRHPLTTGTANLDRIGDLPPVDWRLLSGPGLSTFTDPAAGFSFVANQNGALAERVLHLDTGAYTLVMNAQFDEGGSETRLTWAAICMPSGSPLAIVQNGKRASMVVPAEGCSYQKLSMTLENERLADGAEISGSVRGIWIERSR